MVATTGDERARKSRAAEILAEPLRRERPEAVGAPFWTGIAVAFGSEALIAGLIFAALRLL